MLWKGPHNGLQEKNRDTIVETVTTVFYQTVVWVDNDGTPVSTEINSPPPGAAITSMETIASSAIPAATPADLGAVNRPNWGSQPGAGKPSAAAEPPSSRPVHNYPPSPPSNQPAPSPSSQSSPASGSDAISASTQSSNVVGGMGVCYDMIDSQTKCKESDTINSEFAFLKGKGFGIVRVYDIGCDVGTYVSAAANQGLKLMIGINSVANFDSNLNTLIGMVNGNWGPVDTVYICNECVNSGAASAASVAGYVSSAKGTLQNKGFTGSVVTVDTFNVMMNDATICSTSDYCATNIHPFFDPTGTADQAGKFVHNNYNKVVQKNPGKRVVITESGWPWKGNCNGQACPSVDNQVTAVNGIMGQFSSQASNLFLFQGYNAGYKQPGSFGVEQYFGIFDGDHYDGRIN